MLRTLFLFIALSAALVMGQNPNEWPVLHNINHTGFSPTTVLKPPLKLKWAAKVPGAFKAGPVVAEGKVVIQGREGYLFCFDAETGAPVWRYFVQRMEAHYMGFTETGPCIRNGRVYANFHSAGHPGISGMRCFDLETGEMLWKKPSGMTEHRIHYSPQVTHDRLVFCSNRDIANKQSENPADWVYNAQVQCWDAFTGDTLWTFTMATCFFQNTTLLVAGDTIFASIGYRDGNDSGRTVALDTNGNMLWESTAYNVCGTTGNIQYFDGKLIIPAGGSQSVRIFNTSDFSIALNAGNGTAYSKVNALMNGKYYNRGYGGFARPFSLNSGQATPFAGYTAECDVNSGCGAPAAANGYIYNVFGGGCGITYPPGSTFSPGALFDPGFKIFAQNEAGEIVWWFQDRSHHCASVAIAYDKLYACAGTEGMVYCFENAQ